MYLSTQLASPAHWLKRTVSVVCVSAGLLMTQAASATTVQFQTVMGDFEVNLYDKTTPASVANFLAYVNAGAYQNTIMHRSVPNFIVQGGGYKFTGELPLLTIAQNAKVKNEPVYSNVRGTIAMAKLSTDANSATNQWFINLSNNNAANLDLQNGGFTAFGQVTGNGMAIVDAIAALNTFTVNVLKDFPLRNYSTSDETAKKPVTGDHIMLIQNIVVLNADPDTASALSPTPNTLIKKSEVKKDSGGGSGSLGLLALLSLALLALGRKSLLNRA